MSGQPLLFAGRFRASPSAVSSELVSHAQRYLLRRSQHEKKTKRPQRIVLNSKALSELEEELESPADAEALTQRAVNLTTAVRSLMNAPAAISSLESTVNVLEEELDILWWSFRGYCNALNESLEKLDASGLILPVASDLYDLTTLLPGPYTAREFLRSAIGRGRKPKATYSLRTAVNDAPRIWRDGALEALGEDWPRELCPSLKAIWASINTEGNEDWVPIFEKAFPKTVDRPLPGEAIAHQLYLELSLVRLLA